MTGGAECFVGSAKYFVSVGAECFVGTDFFAVLSACHHLIFLSVFPLHSYKWAI